MCSTRSTTGCTEIADTQADGHASLLGYALDGYGIYGLSDSEGNETEGVSKGVSAIADMPLSIPMRNGVESLNVAVTASLIAFAPYLER